MHAKTLRAALVVVLGAAAAVLPSIAASAAGPADWPSSLPNLGDPRGMVFNADDTRLFVAQRDAGISMVEPDGHVTPLVISPDSFMGVALEPDGDGLLVTRDSDPAIYRLSLADMLADPSSYDTSGGWLTHAQVVFSVPSSAFVYGLAVAGDGTIYYTSFNDRQIYRLVGGVATALFSTAPAAPSNSLSITADGNLLVLDRYGHVGLIPAADLAAGGLSQTDMEPVGSTGQLGLAAFHSGNTFYQADGSKAAITTGPAGTPVGLAAVPGQGSVSLSWTAPSTASAPAATSYEVQRLISGVWSTIGTPTSTALQVDSLTPGEVASFRVRSLSSGGPSAWSAAADATPTTAPAAVTVQPLTGAIATAAPAPKPVLAATGSSSARPVTAVAILALVTGLGLVGARRIRRGRRVS